MKMNNNIKNYFLKKKLINYTIKRKNKLIINQKKNI